MAGRPNTVTIYGIRPIDGDVFYIGSTVKAKESRFRQHLGDVARDRHCNALFASRCLRHGLENLEVIEVAKTSLNRRLDVEYQWIQKYIKQGIRLVNTLKTRRHHQAVVKATQLTDEQRFTREMSKIARWYFILTAWEFTHDQPLFSIRPDAIALARQNAADYKAEGATIERYFNAVLDLYKLNANGVCHPFRNA